MSIDKKILKEYSPDIIGKEIHINHEGCSAGTDNKRRLYIKKVTGGVLGYCHHCNESGFLKDNSSDGDRLRSWLTDKVKTKPYIEEETYALPPRGPQWSASTNVAAKAWLNKYHITHTDKAFKFMYSDKGIYYMLHDSFGDCIGYQERNIPSIKGKPKYYTKFFNTATKRGDSSWFIKSLSNDTLVITEDHLSAYRISRDTPYNALALLRTSISDRTIEEVNELAKEHKIHRIYIWLDNDPAGITGAKEVLSRLLFYTCVEAAIIMHEEKEPKQLNPTELAAVFTGEF